MRAQRYAMSSRFVAARLPQKFQKSSPIPILSSPSIRRSSFDAEANGSLLVSADPTVQGDRTLHMAKMLTNDYISDGLLENGRHRIIAAKCQKTNMLRTLLSG